MPQHIKQIQFNFSTQQTLCFQLLEYDEASWYYWSAVVVNTSFTHLHAQLKQAMLVNCMSNKALQHHVIIIYSIYTVHTCTWRERGREFCNRLQHQFDSLTWWTGNRRDRIYVRNPLTVKLLAGVAATGITLFNERLARNMWSEYVVNILFQHKGVLLNLPWLRNTRNSF